MPAGTRVLALICMVLGAVVWLELTREPASAPGAGDIAVDLPPLPEPPRFEPPPLVAFDQIALRPLFAPTRRPPVPEAAAEEPPPAPMPPAPLAATLIGVTITGADRAALVHTGGGARWLREGQELDGWRLLSIAPDRIELQRGDEAVELRLRRER